MHGGKVTHKAQCKISGLHSKEKEALSYPGVRLHLQPGAHQDLRAAAQVPLPQEWGKSQPPHTLNHSQTPFSAWHDLMP